MPFIFPSFLIMRRSAASNYAVAKAAAKSAEKFNAFLAEKAGE